MVKKLPIVTSNKFDDKHDFFTCRIISLSVFVVMLSYLDAKSNVVFRRSMDHLHYRLNFDLDKNFITA
jgi:hypothetical protein